MNQVLYSYQFIEWLLGIEYYYKDNKKWIMVILLLIDYVK